MGQTSTKRDATKPQLNPEQLQHVKRLFTSLSTTNMKGDKGPYCLYGDVQKHLEIFLDDWLAQRITDRLAVKSPKGVGLVVPYEHFLQFVSQMVKGTISEKIQLVWQLAIDNSPETKSHMHPDEIMQYARSIIGSYIKCSENTAAYASWQGCTKLTYDAISEYAEFLLGDLFYNGVASNEILQTKPNKSLRRRGEIYDCFSKSHLLLSIHDCIFSQCFGVDRETATIQIIPECIRGRVDPSQEIFTLLDFTKIMFLNSHLPSALLRSQWRLLYSTKHHGESFSKLMSSIIDKGPTLIIIKERNGRIFGAFSPDSWRRTAKFFGDETSFLFHLLPKCYIYSATGYNQNFQYMNSQQQTLPNGIGVGGRFGCFGFWLDPEFGRGKAASSCTTYSSPRMSAEEDFVIEHMEVWGLGPEPEKEEGERDERSCLDKDPEAKMMLEMLDRGSQTEEHRDLAGPSQEHPDPHGQPEEHCEKHQEGTPL